MARVVHDCTVTRSNQQLSTVMLMKETQIAPGQTVKSNIRLADLHAHAMSIGLNHSSYRGKTPPKQMISTISNAICGTSLRATVTTISLAAKLVFGLINYPLERRECLILNSALQWQQGVLA